MTIKGQHRYSKEKTPVANAVELGGVPSMAMDRDDANVPTIFIPPNSSPPPESALPPGVIITSLTKPIKNSKTGIYLKVDEWGDMIVSWVAPDSVAAQQTNLKSGMHMLRINGVFIERGMTPTQAASIIAAADSVVTFEAGWAVSNITATVVVKPNSDLGLSFQMNNHGAIVITSVTGLFVEQTILREGMFLKSINNVSFVDPLKNKLTTADAYRVLQQETDNQHVTVVATHTPTMTTTTTRKYGDNNDDLNGNNNNKKKNSDDGSVDWDECPIFCCIPTGNGSNDNDGCAVFCCDNNDGDGTCVCDCDCDDDD